MNTLNIYLIPGLGANTKIFEKIVWPEGVVLHPLEWIAPKSLDESIGEYASRMAENITAFPAVLIGVSFGGIMVQEIAKQINVASLILISSIAHPDELPRRLQFLRLTKTYKLFPSKKINEIEKIALKITQGKTKERLGFYEYYLDKRDPLYLDWSLYQVLNWKAKHTPIPDLHIHGELDEIFPIQNIENCIEVKGGDHAMILTKAKKISSILSNHLQNLRENS